MFLFRPVSQVTGRVLTEAPFLVPPPFPQAQDALRQFSRPAQREVAYDEARALALAELVVAAGLGADDPRRHALANEPGRARAAHDLLIAGAAYRSPFTGDKMEAEDAAALLTLWRDQMAVNRGIDATAGIKPWKQRAIDHLLWDGERTPRHGPPDGPGRRAVWPTKAEPRGGDIIVEDGFIRSAGLGAECREPLSIAVDTRGIYYDAGRPSDLEHILQTHAFDAVLLARAARLRGRLVEAAISKYGARGLAVGLPGGKRLVLVPGQVEDDRSVLTAGGAIQTNAALLAAVRAARPDAHIVFKPHPDVESGLRVGGPPAAEADRLADTVARGASLMDLFAQVDEVHTLTSLTGFEALLRGIPVTTYGAPFYAGWGLTEDRGQIPARRTATRSLDELVAAALILYPRYLDPVTRLPCPPEILVERLIGGYAEAEGVTALTQWRRVQGVLQRMMRRATRRAA